jgi:hypothetical protein
VTFITHARQDEHLCVFQKGTVESEKTAMCAQVEHCTRALFSIPSIYIPNKGKKISFNPRMLASLWKNSTEGHQSLFLDD